MAETLDQILSIEDLKGELRIPDRVTSMDSTLESQRLTAVNFVSQHIGVPLLDRAETVNSIRPEDPEHPLVLRVRGVRSVARVDLWTPAGELRLAPNQRYNAGDLGRLVASHDRFYLWPPVGGWPEILQGSFIEVTVIRGLDFSDHEHEHMALRHAVVLVCRQLFDGYTQIRPTEAFFSIIEPFVKVVTSDTGIPAALSGYILTEAGDFLTAESGDRLVWE